MDRQHRYYAFISYNSADEKWANWLQHSLEYYHLPNVLYKEHPELPRKIRPVFWYKQDLSGTKLKEALDKELAASKYLIVICSPHAATAAWVNDEVNSFIQQGKGDKIIPFIVEGTPHAQTADEECFPPALRNLTREEEIRGIDVRRKGGKSHALVDVIATMFGLRFDVLWQRHERRKKKIRNVWIAAASLLILLALGVYDYKRPRYEYYANYTEAYGKPIGAVRLTEQQRVRRNISYQFEYRRIPFGEPNSYSWRVVRVKAVNSALLPQEISNTEHYMRYPIQEYQYYEKTGNVSQILFYNEQGQLIVKHNLTSRGEKIAAIADIVAADEEKGSGFIGADQLSILYGRMDHAKAKAKIVRLAYERDASGYIVKQTFHSNNDADLSLSAIADENGAYGMTFSIDEQGFPTEVNYIDKKGDRIVSGKGFSTIKYQYDSWTNVTYTEYSNLNDKPVANELNWAICTNVSDDCGNIAEENYFQSKGSRCNSNRGISTIRYEYDTNGFLKNERFYDTEGKPVLNYRGIARYGYKHDRNGNVTESTFYDENDKIKQTIYGFAQARNKYDKNGNCIEVAYLDEKGTPCFSIEGCAKWTRKYDERNNLTEHWFFGTDSKLCLLDGYTAGWTADYNEEGQCIEKRNYDQNQQLTKSDMGYAVCRNTYDSYGNQDGSTYYDEQLQACKSKEGFAQWKAYYNTNGQKTHEAYYDEDGNPCNNTKGYASIEISYNDVGDILSITKYDQNNNVVN